MSMGMGQGAGSREQGRNGVRAKALRDRPPRFALARTGVLGRAAMS